MWKQKAVPCSNRSNLSPADLVAQLGRRIARLRGKKRWTRRHLARRLAVSHKTVGNWERGRCQPAYPLLVALAEHFEISLDELARSEPADDQES